MLNQNEKVERFAEEINKTAMNQCRKIEKQTAKFKNSELEKLKEDAENQLSSRKQYEEETIKTQMNREISALAAAGKSDVINRRNEIMAEVFKKSEKKLIEFTKSDAYQKLLLDSINKLVNAIGEEVIIYVRSDDKSLAESICEKIENVSEVKVSKKVKIGLAFASDKNETVFADDTLEKRLELQKEEFMSWSGLSIQ